MTSTCEKIFVFNLINNAKMCFNHLSEMNNRRNENGGYLKSLAYLSKTPVMKEKYSPSCLLK